MASRSYDHGGMLTAARRLGDAGAELDATGESAPDRMDAGPYAAAIASMLKVVLDNSSELVARMYVSGAVAARATARVAATEAANAANVRRIHDRLESQ